MNKSTFCVLTVSLLLVTACHNGNKTTNANNDTITSTKHAGVSLLCESDECIVIGLVDMENEMPIALFRGSYDNELLDSLMPTGAARSSINAYIAIDENHTVLFDAGLGVDKGGHLMESLKNADIDPDSIDAICLTHLHGDHIGGLLIDGQAAFPNAAVYLSQEEEKAFRDNELWQAISEVYRNRIRTFNDGDTLLDKLIVAKLATGHTPGHTVYVVDGGLCYIVGDLLHAQDLQLDNPEFCASYDQDPAQARATRIKWINDISASSGYMSAAHCYDHFINLHDRTQGR